MTHTLLPNHSFMWTLQVHLLIRVDVGGEGVERGQAVVGVPFSVNIVVKIIIPLNAARTI